MLSDIFQVFLLAMTPIGELRAAIPMGILVYKLNPIVVFIASVLGNIFAAFLLLLLLKPLANGLAKKSKFFHKLFEVFLERTRRKTRYFTEKYGALGLMIFVAVPLPLTGAWTGCLAAYIFNIPFKKAFLSIVSGVVIAGMAVFLATYAGVSIEKYFGLQTLSIIVLMLIIVWAIIKYLKIKKLKIV